jgi:hypothetical protein
MCLRNVLPPSFGLKSKLSKKPAGAGSKLSPAKVICSSETWVVSELHGVTIQKTELSVVIAMRTSNPAYSCFIVSTVFCLHVCNVHKLVKILIACAKFHAEIEFIL